MEAIATRGIMDTDNTTARHTQTDFPPLPDSRFQIRDLISSIENRPRPEITGSGQSAFVNALWGRLNFYQELAQREAGEVEGLLDAKIAGRMREDFLANLGALPPGASLQAGEDGEAAAFLVELSLLLNRATMGATPTSTIQANAELDEELRRELGDTLRPERRVGGVGVRRPQRHPSRERAMARGARRPDREDERPTKSLGEGNPRPGMERAVFCRPRSRTGEKRRMNYKL